MTNPIDLSALTLSTELLIRSKGLRIQPLVFVTSLGIFVQEAGERENLCDPGCRYAGILPPLVSER